MPPRADPFEGPFVKDYIQSLKDLDLVQYQRKIEDCGFDPFDLEYLTDVKEDVNMWPKVTVHDRIEYFVTRTSSFTNQQMKNFKSLDAHNFLTSGHVREPRLVEISEDRVLALCVVEHSQRLRNPPLRCWLLVEKDGVIVSSQCTCMAGRTACSHVAAVAYKFEYKAAADASLSCTDVLCAWLPTEMRGTAMKEVRDVDFTSAAKRKSLLDAALVGADTNESVTPSRPRKESLLRLPTAEEDHSFLQDIASCSPLSAILSHYSDFCQPWVSEVCTPLDLSKLYDESKENLTFEELLGECKVVLEKMKVTEDEIRSVEKATIRQSHSASWVTLRMGRITSTKISLVMQGDIQAPAETTIKAICHPSQKDISYLPDIQRGNQNEPKARKWYSDTRRDTHHNLKVSTMGLVLHPERPYLAASPDGRVTCSCCLGFGVLEIKCPREANFLQYFDANGELLQEGPTKHIYRQVQCHLLVTGASYCDFISYIGEQDGQQKVVRVLPDQVVHAEMLEKAHDYYLHVCLPELVAHWYQRQAPVRTGGTVLQPINNQIEPICFCRKPPYGKYLDCHGKSSHCFKTYHFSCVGLLGWDKRKKYICQICETPARRRRNTTSMIDENTCP